MYTAARRKTATEPARGCYKEYGAKVSGGHCGKPALFWPFAREAICGYKGMVRAEVGNLSASSCVWDLSLMIL